VSQLLNIFFFVHIDICWIHPSFLLCHDKLRLGVMVFVVVLACHPYFFSSKHAHPFLCFHRLGTKLYLCNLLRLFLAIKKCVPFLVSQLCSTYDSTIAAGGSIGGHRL
jgi:hypothetical protein